MLIRDLESKSGLDRATIRFYEKEGFIKPQRKENGYREYSPDDLDHLMKIKLMRQLGMSLDTIKEIQQGRRDLENALLERIQRLDLNIQNAEKAKSICKELYDLKASYNSLNAEYYLNQFHMPSENVPTPSFSERLERPYHPIRRLFARLTDYALVTLLLEIIFVTIIRIRPVTDFISNIITWTNVLISIPVSAWMLLRFGTTPGKWLYGLGVRSENGDKLCFRDSMLREWNVLKLGMGFHIPLWSTWRLWNSFRDYQEGEMEWDQRAEYQYATWNPVRKRLLTVCIVFIISANLLVCADMICPKHQGSITIEEFATNYNYYSEILAGKNESYARMASDGTWVPESPGTITVYATAQPTYPKQTFDYQIENDKISKISYTNEWTEIIWFAPLQTECERAAITALMSQKGTGPVDFIQFIELLNDTTFEHDGMITYKNINVSWQIETTNCQYWNNKFFSRIDDTKESNVHVSFEIVIH